MFVKLTRKVTSVHTYMYCKVRSSLETFALIIER